MTEREEEAQLPAEVVISERIDLLMLEVVGGGECGGVDVVVLSELEECQCVSIFFYPGVDGLYRW